MAEKMKNKRKVVGSYVWHDGELKRITNQNVGKDYVIVGNQFKIKRTKIRLAKIGDSVEYKSLNILPSRCASHKKIKITYFMDNDLIGTNMDAHEHDTTNYGHFKLKNY